MGNTQLPHTPPAEAGIMPGSGGRATGTRTVAAAVRPGRGGRGDSPADAGRLARPGLQIVGNDGPAAFGWSAYAPLDSSTHSPGVGLDL
ncbi:hypothetical protein [Streptomyces acidiscabies]|uniref:hypothetical protein n=1 Tax=Streptomyces acidiscabies TaxID=42234 RepID=UPI00095D2E5C|nr:hypothetical protein [Streptomyces acidiscabies]GAV44479.1 hypothetical protein Saa2_07449 [Streptomyces acidiscabies]